MFLHPMTLAPLLGVTAALAWVWLRPGALPAIAAIAYEASCGCCLIGQTARSEIGRAIRAA